MKPLLRWINDNRLITGILIFFAVLYIAIPLQLQAMEPYAYAAAIEKYYSLSATFAIAQGEYLPDFSRYHPNHPLGHILAGVAFDSLRVPALYFLRCVNILSALAAGFFLYLISRQIRLSSSGAGLVSGLFLGTHAGLLSVFSGEWHIPAIALSLAGLWQAICHMQNGSRRSLYLTSLLFAMAVCYHMAALSIVVPVAVVIFFLHPLRGRWRALLIAGSIGSTLICLMYFVLPFFIFRFESISNFLGTFLIYKHLSHVRYAGIDWVTVAGQTAFNAFAITPQKLNYQNIFTGFFFLTVALSMWQFFRSHIQISLRILVLAILIWWPVAQALFDARADGMNGWIFLLPFLCLIIIKGICGLHTHAIRFAALLAALVFTWNTAQAILPNSFYKQNDIFLFDLPQNIPKTTPIAFVLSNPVLTMSDIWYAGSRLGYRNQADFFPCCGEADYVFRLRRWLRANPGAIIVSDGIPEATEVLLFRERLNYVRWRDRSVSWPATLLPATIFVRREPDYRYYKRMTIWLPAERMPIQ